MQSQNADSLKFVEDDLFFGRWNACEVKTTENITSVMNTYIWIHHLQNWKSFEI